MGTVLQILQIAVGILSTIPTIVQSVEATLGSANATSAQKKDNAMSLAQSAYGMLQATDSKVTVAWSTLQGEVSAAIDGAVAVFNAVGLFKKSASSASSASSAPAASQATVANV